MNHKLKIKSILEKLNLGRYVMKNQPKADAAIVKDIDKDSPYVKGRMAWDELYGSTATQLENSHRLLACLCAVILGLGLICWHVASQSKIQPYIVQVTSNGQVITGMQAQSFSSSDIPQSAIEGVLYKFMLYSRGVTGDPDVDQDDIYAAQALTTGDAFTTLSNYYQQNNPLILGKNQKVTIQVQYEIPRTANTYEIAWQETTTTLSDQPVSQKNFIGEITYKIGDVKDIKYNPLGIYITNITWTQQI